MRDGVQFKYCTGGGGGGRHYFIFFIKAIIKGIFFWGGEGWEGAEGISTISPLCRRDPVRDGVLDGVAHYFIFFIKAII